MKYLFQKIPSVKITDIAEAIEPKIKIKYSGIRPGEKLSEILCSRDEYFNTIEFKDYYLLKPSIKFIDQNISYLKSKDGEKGKMVPREFEYSSANNKKFLKVSEIKNFIRNEFKNKLIIGCAQTDENYGLSKHKKFEEVLNNAIKSGINFLDTSPHYKNNNSIIKKFTNKKIHKLYLN